MRTTLAGACVLLAATTAAAVDLVMDRPAVDAAVRTGQSSSDRDRARFHAAYRLLVGNAPLDAVDLITPFRRVVLAAETRARLGDRMFGQRQALEILKTSGNQVDIVAEFTFHPLHAFVGVPNYTIRLGAVTPIMIDRIPRYAPGPSSPMTGGTVIAHFDGKSLSATAVYEVIVEEAGKELARARVDFGMLR